MTYYDEHGDLRADVLARDLNRVLWVGDVQAIDRAWRADRELAEAARDYVSARLSMSDAPGSTETAIARLDDAWRALVDCYDQENPK